jgi:L-cysteate sulfo-lyase
LADPLGDLPRISLATLPTPLHDAPNLRAALGGDAECPRILIKRDDLTGLAFGGNKVRKLEFLIADALKQGATDVITAGAVQSNHCRATVAACVVTGLRPTVVLDTDDPDQTAQGNLLLNRMMGARVDLVAPATDKPARINELADAIRAVGRVPYVIPVGGSNAIGTVGYLTMAQELSWQLAELNARPSRIYFGSGSRGTQAGITLGAKLFDISSLPVGVCVSKNTSEKVQNALNIANGAAEMIGSRVRLTGADLINETEYYGDGYAVPTEAGDAAIDLLAKTEAIFLDPVYTGKAMSCLIDHIRTGQIEPTDTVVFVHTGGNPSIFVHAERLAGRAGIA